MGKKDGKREGWVQRSGMPLASVSSNVAWTVHHVPACVLARARARLLMYSRTWFHPCLRAHLPTYWRAWLLACLIACLLACVPFRWLVGWRAGFEKLLQLRYQKVCRECCEKASKQASKQAGK